MHVPVLPAEKKGAFAKKKIECTVPKDLCHRGTLGSANQACFECTKDFSYSFQVLPSINITMTLLHTGSSVSTEIVFRQTTALREKCSPLIHLNEIAMLAQCGCKSGAAGMCSNRL